MWKWGIFIRINVLLLFDLPFASWLASLLDQLFSVKELRIFNNCQFREVIKPYIYLNLLKVGDLEIYPNFLKVNEIIVMIIASYKVGSRYALDRRHDMTCISVLIV